MIKKKRNAPVVLNLIIFIFLATITNVIAVEPGKVSRTAIWTTFFRAIGAREPNENVRTNDTFAEKIITSISSAGLFPKINFNRDDDFWVDQVKSNPRSGYYFINIRTKHIDAILCDSLKNKVKQVVNLGAGYDSRAYRFHQKAPEVKYFEIDLPEMIADKKIRVQEILGVLPDWVTYVSIDFNKQTLSEELIKAGYDKNKKTLFVWEGVTYYISKEAVTSTLQFVASQSSPGSSIVFDYIPYSIEEINRIKLTEGWRESSGEPITYGIEDGKLETFLSQLGLKVVSDLNLLELDNKYHFGQSGLLSKNGKIAYAIVSGGD